MPAPYRIADADNGLFALQPDTAGGAPTDEEAALAKAIGGRLRWLRDEPEKAAGMQPDYGDGLRRIAEQGLTGESGRDAARATAEFETLYGPLEPETGQPGDGAAREGIGPFRIGADEETGEIHVERFAGELSDDQRAFLDELIRKERLIGHVVDNGATAKAEKRALKAETGKRLAMAARLGLEGAQPDLTLARLAVDAVVDDAVRSHGPKVRERYLWRLAGAYARGALAVVAVAALEIVLEQRGALPAPFALPALKTALLAVALLSLLTGAWLSAAQRLRPDSPEVLSEIFSQTLNVRIRMVLVLGFGFLTVLLLYKQVMVFSFGEVGAGGFSTRLVLDKVSAAILTGALLGISERALPGAIVQRSASVVAALTKK